MAENTHHPSAGRVSPALSSMSDSQLPTVHTPLMVGQEDSSSSPPPPSQGRVVLPSSTTTTSSSSSPAAIVEDNNNNNYDTVSHQTLQQQQQQQSSVSSTVAASEPVNISTTISTTTTSSPHLPRPLQSHCHPTQQQQQQQQPLLSHYHQLQQQQHHQQQQQPLHLSSSSLLMTNGADYSGPPSTNSCPPSSSELSVGATTSTIQMHQLHHHPNIMNALNSSTTSSTTTTTTGLHPQCLALQHTTTTSTDLAHSLSEGMDLPMTVCPSLERSDTPTFSFSGGEPSFSSSSQFLQEGSLPTICTPLMEGSGHSDSCNMDCFILPSGGVGGAITNGGDKSETASIYVPICRICHMSSEDGGEVLISPCRCAGTLQFIHNTCLQKWLEIMSKKSRKPPKCELCHFQYNRHKKFKFHHWRFPRVSRQDKILHIVFIANLIMMIGCAVATVMSFLSDKGTIHPNPPENNVELSTEEIVTLSCGVLFFVSFFIAMSVQIKAKHTIYQLFVKFIMQNMEWEIDEYDKSKDTLYKDLYKGLPVYV